MILQMVESECEATSMICCGRKTYQEAEGNISCGISMGFEKLNEWVERFSKHMINYRITTHKQLSHECDTEKYSKKFTRVPYKSELSGGIFDESYLQVVTTLQSTLLSF